MANVTKKINIVSKNVSEDKTPRWKEYMPMMVMSMLLAMALGVAGYFYYQYNHTPQIAEANEINVLVDKIGKVVSLPQNEVPTLATVTNKDRLDDQSFFQKAENDDKILIYSIAKQAFLYRPSTGKLIEIASDVNIEKE